MDSFELNKIIGALLGVVFVVFSIELVSGAIFSTPAPETPGYAIAVPENGQEAEAEADQGPESVLPLLASADASAGENVFKRCQACHTVEQGGANKVGPNLWDVVNRPVASVEGFSYSSAMQDFAQGGEVTWTYENLDHFLLDPRGFIPGTAMAFAGLGNIEDRANIIAYLRNMSDNPAPLPEAPAPEAEEGAADGEAQGDAEAAPAEGENAAPAEEGAQEAAPAEGENPAPATEGNGETAPAENTTGESGAAGVDGTGETGQASPTEVLEPDTQEDGAAASSDQQEEPASSSR